MGDENTMTITNNGKCSAPPMPKDCAGNLDKGFGGNALGPAPREIRAITAIEGEVELRQDDDTARVAVGFAAVFNVETVIYNWFREVIRPGAFARAIREKQDVRALKNHRADDVLGRTASGTLRLEERATGLWVEIELPETTVANDLVVEMKRGDVNQMSFAFRVPDRGERWTELKGEMPLREILDVDLFDVSIVTYPQYKETVVGLRTEHAVFQDYIASQETPPASRGGDDEDSARVDSAEGTPSDPQAIVDVIRAW